MPASRNDIDVRRHLIGLLRHEESVDDFVDWFHPANWSIERYGTEEDYDIASRIENQLAELSGGWIDDDGLLEGLRADAVEFGVEWQPVAQLAGEPRIAS